GWRHGTYTCRIYGRWITTATTRSAPSNTSANSPCTVSLSSETVLTPSGSLRATSSTWSSWYQRDTLGSLAAYSGRFGSSAGPQLTMPPCWEASDRCAGPPSATAARLSRTWVWPRWALVTVCDRVMSASAASPYLPGTPAGSSV